MLIKLNSKLKIFIKGPANIGTFEYLMMIIIFILALAMSIVVPQENTTFNLTVRKFDFANSFDQSIVKYENESTYYNENLTIRKNHFAVVVVDVWDRNSTTNKGFYDRAVPTTERIKDLITFCRAYNISIIHVYNLYTPEIRPLSGEYVVDSYDREDDYYEMERFLKEIDTDVVFFTGYAANMCVLFNPTGMEQLHSKGWNVVIVRDCTLALETNETLDKEWMKYAAITMAEVMYKGSITKDELESWILKNY